MKQAGFTKKSFQLIRLKSGSEIFGKNTRLDRYYPSGTNSPNYFMVSQQTIDDELFSRVN
jgi:hypothetical protein